MDVLLPDHLHFVASDSGRGWLRGWSHRQNLSLNPAGLTFPIGLVGPVSKLWDTGERNRWIEQNEDEFSAYRMFSADGDHQYPDMYLSQSENEVRRDGLDNGEAASELWEALFEPDRTIMFWMSSRSLHDVTIATLMAQYRLSTEKVTLIDVSQTRKASKEPMSVGVLSFEQLDEANLPIRAFSGSLQTKLRNNFSTLLKRDAPLRRLSGPWIVEPQEFSEFDDGLIAVMPSNWQPAARIVGQFTEQDYSKNLYNCDYYFILSRLKSLISNGRIDQRYGKREADFGDPAHWGEIKLAL
ncbi:MAG: DUF3658 domain-containing protein [Pseudomonadota bacterium]